MNRSKQLFFIALLPPQQIQDQATEIKQYFAKNYGSSHALKSPPHVTLQPPFRWLINKLDSLEDCLANFAQLYNPILIRLSGFGAFPPRVIYINVLKTPELMVIQKALMSHLEQNMEIIHEVSKRRPFSPHMTVAFKDLTRKNFRASWPEFEQKPLQFEFVVPQLTLLIHDGNK